MLFYDIVNIISLLVLRYGILSKGLHGELKSVDMDKVNEWREQLKFLCEGFEPENIYNCDETALFYRALPTRSLATKLEICNGTKLIKDRLSILFCTNATGGHLPPFVIVRYKHPRCFGKVDAALLPTQWAFNRRAWMTAELFRSWLIKLDNKFKREKRKVLMFLDNASSHPNIKLDAITLRFLPPLCTAALQPLDQGIIRSFKAQYRTVFKENFSIFQQRRTY